MVNPLAALRPPTREEAMVDGHRRWFVPFVPWAGGGLWGFCFFQAALVGAGENPGNPASPRNNLREPRRESTRIPGENPAICVATARNPENPRPKSTSEMLASFTGRTGTLHRAPVGQGPPGPGWLATSFGFGLGGRLLLLARRGRVYV